MIGETENRSEAINTKRSEMTRGKKDWAWKTQVHAKNRNCQLIISHASLESVEAVADAEGNFFARHKY